MTIRVGSNFFSGAAQVHGKNGLAGIVRALAQDIARSALVALNPSDLTDSSTGTNNPAGFVDAVLPARFDASSAGGVQAAALNTALGKIANAHKVILTDLAPLRAKLGLDAVTMSFGTVGSAHTLPALDKTVTGATGSSAANFETGHSALLTTRDNHRKVLAAFAEVMVAAGKPKLPMPFRGSMKLADALTAPVTVAAGGTGNPAISKAQTDAFLLAVANNLATLANRWNAVFPITDDAPVAVVAV